MCTVFSLQVFVDGQWKQFRTGENKNVLIYAAKCFAPETHHAIVEEFFNGTISRGIVFDNREGSK